MIWRRYDSLYISTSDFLEHYKVRMSSKNVHDSGSPGSQVLRMTCQSNAGWSTKLEVDKQARFQKQVSWGDRLVEGVVAIFGQTRPVWETDEAPKKSCKSIAVCIGRGRFMIIEDC